MYKQDTGITMYNAVWPDLFKCINLRPRGVLHSKLTVILICYYLGFILRPREVPHLFFIKST